MVLRLVMFSVIALAPLALRAVPESRVDEDFGAKILPYWKSGQHFTFAGKDNATIVAHYFAKGDHAPAIVLLPGRAEPSQNYAEFIYDLRDSPYAIYVIDHRGQGASSRLASEYEVGHVRSRNDYVTDLTLLLQKFVRPRQHRKTFIVAHSMGGNIAVRLLAQFPGYADALVMTSPMFKINTGSIPRPIGRALCFAENLVGQGKHFALGKTKWIQANDTFANNVCTRSPSRFAMYTSFFREDPRLRVGGPSYGWALEAFRSEDTIRDYDARSFLPPTLVLAAGKDKIVDANSEKDFCLRTARDCKFVEYPDAYHHLILERDAIRNPVMRQIRGFLNAHLRDSTPGRN